MFADMSTAEILKLAAPILIIQIGLVFFCLFKLAKDKVRYLPKWAWALIIICINLFGAVFYLLIGRERD